MEEIKKGQIVKVKIRDFGDRGQGIGSEVSTNEGLTVFVEGLLPGDIALCKLIKVKKRYAIGRIDEILEYSKDRIDSPCSYTDSCGGCPLMSLDYPEQLHLKENKVKNLLSRIGGITDPVVRPIISMEEPFRYRNKATMAISTGGNRMEKGGILINLGKPAIGFYTAGTNTVIDCKECLIQDSAVMAAAAATRRFMEDDNISAYDDTFGLGLMRHMVVRTSKATGEVMVTYIINGKGIPNTAKLLQLLDEAIYETGYFLESVNLNINKGKTKDVYGQETICIAGKPVIKEKFGHLNLEVSPRSFYQVNPEQTVNLYNKVLEYANLTGKETLLDIYCGVGSIGLFCAKHEENKSGAAYVLGIESTKEAVVDANRNAVINKIVNARFLCGKAEEELPKLLAGEGDHDLVRAVENASVVILDPPRKGCKEELLDAVCKVSPERIVYVSCDPSTLARDICYLSGRGYKFVEATPVDMFPHSVSIEVITLLSKLDSKKYISVELPMDELDLTSAESKATYAQIKEYILEKFDLKVSTLYIAQVKKKCGIELRKNYNKSKKEKQVIPQCTPEKEDAIMDALRHFKMI